jgi:hypothetical protein
MSATPMTHTPSVAVLARDEAGRLALRQPFPAAGQLFGLLFMLPGLKLLQNLIVYLDRDEDAARAIAREIAASTALPLRDDVKHQDDSEDND